jgi:hypothetical protein
MNKGGFILKKGTKKIGGYNLPTTMLDGYENTIKNKIHGNCTWIMGYPGETLYDLKHSIKFIEWQVDLVAKLNLGDENSINKSIFIATAYPGTAMFKDPIAMSKLNNIFNINFDNSGNPLPDENLYKYILELDDATKLLTGKDGLPLNFSAMEDDVFYKAVDYVKNKQTLKIIEM